MDLARWRGIGCHDGAPGEWSGNTNRKINCAHEKRVDARVGRCLWNVSLICACDVALPGVYANKLCVKAALLLQHCHVKPSEIFEGCHFSCVSLLVSTVTMYTRSFSF